MEPSASTSEKESTTPLQALEDQITLLTELNSRVHDLRRATTFLRPTTIPVGLNGGGGVLPIYQTPPIQDGFTQLKALSEKIRSDAVQDALKAAKERALKDPGGLNLSRKRKRPSKRPLTPEPPQSFRSFRPKSTSLFPPDDNLSTPPLRLNTLVAYLREHNKSNRSRLQIWTATAQAHDRSLPDPLVIRFIVSDVFIVYLMVGTTGSDSTLVVESATAFGSREKKPPHTQSEFIVFQRLSQHLAKMLQSKPQASFQLVMQLLSSYEDLFIRPCTACRRVISTEGHIPPVVRKWLEAETNGEKGQWDARHPVCDQ
ncbi:hypothetical protein BDW22DRAFT_1355002 [Trametopsis cervina]|nr:hypothetical protein BDW22DRAFT_1355002 [Trametopsis cervina]